MNGDASLGAASPFDSTTVFTPAISGQQDSSTA